MQKKHFPLKIKKPKIGILYLAGIRFPQDGQKEQDGEKIEIFLGILCKRTVAKDPHILPQAKANKLNTKNKPPIAKNLFDDVKSEKLAQKPISQNFNIKNKIRTKDIKIFFMDSGLEIALGRVAISNLRYIANFQKNAVRKLILEQPQVPRLKIFAPKLNVNANFGLKKGRMINIRV